MTKQYRGKLQTVIEDIQLPNPVIRSHFGKGFIKQYVRDHLNLRTEPATNNVADYGIKKAVEHLPALREPSLSSIIDSYLNVQQDILETFVDRGQLRQLAQPTVLPNGKRIPGLKLGPSAATRPHARPRALCQHRGRQHFHHRRDLPAHPQSPGCVPDNYSLASLRYDLYKLSAKGLVHKLPRSRRYQLTPQGYSLCLVFLKLFERIYAPLTAGLLHPVPGDRKLQQQGNPNLTASISESPTISTNSSTLSASSSPPDPHNENKIPVTAPITV